ncbi:MAG: hypothetical protein ABFC63_10945 [Thermoguttaceae bacterium]
MSTLGTSLHRFAVAASIGVAVALAGCAAPPKKTVQYAVPRSLGSQTSKAESKSSGASSWFKSSEPEKKPSDVPSWMENTKRMDP